MSSRCTREHERGTRATRRRGATRDRARARQRGARLLHQVPERHDDGHAASQPRHCDALLHRGRGTRRRSARPSSSTARIAAMRPRGDAISRPVTRYVGQCGRHSPHDDARDELVGVEARAARSGRVRSQRQPSRVAACRSGSNASLMRRISVGVRQRAAEAVVAGVAAGLAQHPAAVRVRDRARVRRAPSASSAGDVHGADAELGAPARTVDRRARVRRARTRAGRDRDAAAVRARRAARAASRGVEPGAPARRRRPRRPRAGRARAARPRARAAGRKRSRRRRRPRTQRDARGARPAAQRHLREHAERAERPDEQPRQVVAGHVLDRRAAALHHAAVAGRRSAPRARGRAAGRAAGGGCPRARTRACRRPSRPAIARVERALLAVLGERRVERGERRARADGDGQVGGLVRDDAGGRAHLGRAGGRRAADLPLRARADGRPTVATAASARVVRSTCPPAHAAARRSGCPRGSTFCGLAAPSGSNASRSRACASRSSAENSSGMRSRFSTPTPCSPVSTPPASRHVVEDLVARRVHALPHAGLAPVEHEQRVQVAVAGVEHVHHDDARARRRSRTPAAARRRACVRGTTASCR